MSKPPDWHPLSHHGRYQRLHKVRRVWGRLHKGAGEDRRGRTLHLDGTWINDIPSFYLSMGEAVNGRNGYFGADLDALSDCLCGGFGVLPPLTIRVSRFDAVREALDGRAWLRFHAEGFRRAVAAGESVEQLVEWGYFDDGTDSDVARWTAIYEAALVGQPFDSGAFGSFFDAVVEVLKAGGAELVPEDNSMSDEPMTGLTVRRLTREDMPALYDLRQRILRPGRPPEASIFAGDDAPSTVHIGAYTEDGRLVGIATLVENNGFQLRGMAVDDDVQKRGVGAAVLQEVHAVAAERGFGSVWANARHYAVPFYERNGWVVESDEFEVPDVGPHFIMRRVVP